MLLTAIIFILVLVVLVISHEWGHFIAARLSGVKVEEFAFGFPPKLVSFVRRGTRFAFNLIPLGGYVKMKGEDGSHQEDGDSFASQTVGKKLFIIIAGVVMNIVLAWILFSITFAVGAAPLVSKYTDFPSGAAHKTLLVTEVKKDSAAAVANFKIGDEIIAINGARPDSAEALVTFNKAHRGEGVTYQVKRKKATLTLTATLAKSDPPLGVAVADQILVQVPVWQAPIVGALETGRTILLTGQFLGSMFKKLIVAHEAPKDVAGPIGIFTLTGAAAQVGFIYVVELTAILSVNLALLNILPLPPLDGGRAAMTIIGKFAGRRRAQLFENWASIVGIALIVILLIFVTFQDIRRLIN